MEFVLHDKEVGYYSGQNQKYADLFNTNTKKYAKPFESEQHAIKIRDRLNKVGYNFVIEEQIK